MSEVQAPRGMKAIRIHSNGGGEVMKYEDAPIPDIGPNDVLIKNHVCGVNYIDVYHRTGKLSFFQHFHFLIFHFQDYTK